MNPNAYAFTDKSIVNSLHWLSKALGKDEQRMQLTYLRVESDCVIATCGRRLHKWNKSLGIEKGCYSLIITKEKSFYDEDCDDFAEYPSKAILIKSNSRYPKWSQVIPSHDKSIDIIFTDSLAPYVSMKTGVCLNCDFVKEAAGESNFITVRYGDSIKQVVIEYSDRVAVIMPIKTPEMEDNS